MLPRFYYGISNMKYIVEYLLNNISDTVETLYKILFDNYMKISEVYHNFKWADIMFVLWSKYLKEDI